MPLPGCRPVDRSFLFAMETFRICWSERFVLIAVLLLVKLEFLPCRLCRFCTFLSLELSLIDTVKRAVQYWLDKSTIHVVPRWLFFGFLLFLFFLRIYLVQGYFIVAYGLGIFLFFNFIETRLLLFLEPLDHK